MLNITFIYDFCLNAESDRLMFDTARWVVATLQLENPHHSQKKNCSCKPLKNHNFTHRQHLLSFNTFTIYWAYKILALHNKRELFRS